MLLLFNGPPGSGKDEACSILRKHGFEQKMFKEQLFVDVLEYYKLSYAQCVDFFLGYYDRTRKEDSVDYLKGSRREAMIHVSENVMKKIYGNSRYGDAVASQLVDSNHYCMSDGGFEEELAPVIGKIGPDNLIIVQIFRDGFTFAGDSRSYLKGRLVNVIGSKHEDGSAELSAEELKNVNDYTDPKSTVRLVQLYNNGSLDDFRKNIEELRLWMYRDLELSNYD